MKITEQMIDAAMEKIMPGMAVDRTDMKRALEAAISDDCAVQPVVIVHFERGDVAPSSYHVVGDCRLFIVDENAPNDRVYECLGRDEASIIRELIPEGAEIGNKEDSRHAAIENAILSAVEGRPRLSVVPTPSNGGAND